MSLEDFEGLVEARLGVKLRRYQLNVIGDVLSELEKGARAIFVSMPTGSGKTLIETYFGYWSVRNELRVLVIEPTRILCEQMLRVWRRVLGATVGLSYEGDCRGLEDCSKRVVIATPQTALKCLSSVPGGFDVVIIDEVHHAFGTALYRDMLYKCRPSLLLGFTALVPSYRRQMGIAGLPGNLGSPVFLDYDFKALSEMGGFSPPLAIADFYDACFDDLENTVYDMLFRGVGFKACPRVIKHLELTLARHGARAFCESLHSAVDKGDADLPPAIFEELCSRDTPSHKARAVVEVLSKYDIESVKPILVYTTRKQTAYEIAEVLASKLKLRVSVLTGDVPRHKRAVLVSGLRKGEADALVSTRVGEEGLDIPEAGLLVMSDIAKSELRFYQRLGRLLRLVSPRRLKYLVLTLTPRTVEYDDLREATWSLQAAGVDISYVVVNITELSARMRAAEVVETLADSTGGAVPYTLLHGRAGSADLISSLQRISALEDEQCTIEELVHTLFSINTRRDTERKLLRELEKLVPQTRATHELDMAIETGRVLYIYDVEPLARVLAAELRALEEVCTARGEFSCKNPFFRLDRKGLLKLFMRLFPNKPEHIERVRKWLEREVERLASIVDSLSDACNITVYPAKYNPTGSCLIARLRIDVRRNSLTLTLEPHVYYYGVVGGDHVSLMRELSRLNLLAAGYMAVVKYLRDKNS